MFFAVIGDIESNFSGLTAVLAALDQEGIHRVMHTGNTCMGPSHARECLALLRERGVFCVQGKHDKAVVRAGRIKRDANRDAAAADVYSALDSDAVEYLAALPRTRRLTEEGRRILLCHGSVNSASLVLTPDTPRAVFHRQREIAEADIVVCGGAKTPFSYHIDSTLFVCPGTMTLTANTARCLLVKTETFPWSAETIFCEC